MPASLTPSRSIPGHGGVAARTPGASLHTGRPDREGDRLWAKGRGTGDPPFGHGRSGAHFTKALDLLASLPESPDRDRREFRLQLARAGALVQASGWASPQMGEAYSRAAS